MSEPSIPVALGPKGNVVPIEEAERFKTDYYRCRDCNEILNPRKGAIRTHYYAHKQGALEGKTCALSSQSDIDELLDELRTSDIEKNEQDRHIRTYIGEAPGSRIRLFGVLPSLDWDTIPQNTDVNSLIDSMSIRTKGVKNPPTPGNFHPSEPEVLINLDPGAEEITVDIEGGKNLNSLTGKWKGIGLSDGNLFVGDQSRARRHRNNQQIKFGEWVYLATTTTPKSLPEAVHTHSLGPFSVLAFAAKNETESLLDEYGDGLTADQYGFDADVILPAAAHPTSEAPIKGKQGKTIFVSVTPSPDIDPIFEVVSIPRREGDVVEIAPTGPGNPRYFNSQFPSNGSRRISIHQRNSNRHRLVHLHSRDKNNSSPEKSCFEEQIGLKLDLDEEELLLTPFEEDSQVTILDEAVIAALPARVSYVGPQGLEIEFVAQFSSKSPHGQLVRRSTTNIQQVVPEISQWALQGCEKVAFDFDGLGSVHINFTLGSDSEEKDLEEELKVGGIQ